MMSSATVAPPWILAGAAVAQVVLAFVLWRATMKYVNLTAALAETNQEQLNEIRAGAQAAMRGQLVRIRQLVDQIRTSLTALPERLEGSGVDRSIRYTSMWRDEPKELVRLAADLLPSAQHDAREVANNIDWIAERVAEVRRTTPEQGFRYEKIDRLEWQNRREGVLKGLAGIDEEASQALASANRAPER